ncbi:MAG TPA: hypothetical protein PLQ93_02880 [Bacteroidia bacterium]|nr:hypothetical protein [Bacteroidia bacterium]
MRNFTAFGVLLISLSGLGLYFFLRTKDNLPAPEICFVSVDAESRFNTIHWKKRDYIDAEQFIVYRRTGFFSGYDEVARLDASIDDFTDDYNKTPGLKKGDPNQESNSYKIAYLNRNGEMSELSPYHSSIFLQHIGNGNFEWNYYKTGDKGELRIDYNLVKVNPDTQDTIPVCTVQTDHASDPDYNNTDAINYIYFVLVNSNCADNLGVLGSRNRTKSNNTNE